MGSSTVSSPSKVSEVKLVKSGENTSKGKELGRIATAYEAGKIEGMNIEATNNILKKVSLMKELETLGSGRTVKWENPADILGSICEKEGTPE